MLPMYHTVNLSLTSSKENKYLSTPLLEKIEAMIREKKKTILYINRRWEYTGLVCCHCQFLYKCPNCDTSLTVFASQKLQCQICGYHENLPLKCKKCNSVELEKVGVWTEQIEKSIKNLFPSTNIFRFDSDSISTKKERESILKSLEEADIIIGTKMITTGFDFKDIWLIGVILLEQELIFPSYNTEEKVFFNMKQLFWRAKRGKKEYEIILQTFIPQSPIIERITTWNYSDFFKHTLQERKQFSYPPYGEIAHLEYRHKDKDSAKLFIAKLKSILEGEEKTDWEIFSPDIPKKRYNQYYFSLYIKWVNLQEKLEIIRHEIMRNPALTLEFE